MSRRRPVGQGSVYRRKDGRWEARLPLAGGGRWMATVRTQREAYERLNRAIRDRDAGLRPRNERITVAEFLTRWLEESAQPSVRPGTYASYEPLVRVHLVPELGHVRLARLMPDQVHAALNRRRAAGQSAANTAKMRTVLRRALAIGVRLGLIHQNAAALAEPPKVERRRARPLTPEDTRVFMRAAEADPLNALWVLALVTGLRRGELLGLLWDDLDEALLTIRQQLIRVRLGPHRWRLEMAPLKTESGRRRGRRRAALASAAVSALRDHRQRQVQDRLAIGASWVGSVFGELVFVTGIGTPLDPDNVSKQAKQVLTAAGFPDRRMHDLRATFGSLLLDQGTDLKVVSALMAHSTIKLTADTYIRVLDRAARDAAAGFDRLLQAN